MRTKNTKFSYIYPQSPPCQEDLRIIINLKKDPWFSYYFIIIAFINRKNKFSISLFSRVSLQFSNHSSLWAYDHSHKEKHSEAHSVEVWFDFLYFFSATHAPRWGSI